MAKKLKPIKYSLATEIASEVADHLRDTLDVRQVGMTEDEFNWLYEAITLVLASKCYSHKDLQK